MPTPYPIELRARVVASIEEEKLSFRETAERFAVSLRWVVTLLRRWRQEQTLVPRPHAGGRDRKIHPAAEGWLTTWLDAEPDLTQEQLCERLAEPGRRPLNRFILSHSAREQVEQVVIVPARLLLLSTHASVGGCVSFEQH
ncbi:MAG: hypothetical protein Q8S73_02120, partial [Deltaproteobacteria bacterium]|nr:hypothetical protein [Deltaproteobacteria bacterium]